MATRVQLMANPQRAAMVAQQNEQVRAQYVANLEYEITCLRAEVAELRAGTPPDQVAETPATPPPSYATALPTAATAPGVATAAPGVARTPAQRLPFRQMITAGATQAVGGTITSRDGSTVQLLPGPAGGATARAAMPPAPMQATPQVAGMPASAFSPAQLAQMGIAASPPARGLPPQRAIGPAPGQEIVAKDGSRVMLLGNALTGLPVPTPRQPPNVPSAPSAPAPRFVTNQRARVPQPKMIDAASTSVVETATDPAPSATRDDSDIRLSLLEID